MIAVTLLINSFMRISAVPLYDIRNDVITSYENHVNLSMQLKEHPGHNFIGLVFGPSSDTQKRVEKVYTCCSTLFCGMGSTVHVQKFHNTQLCQHM